MKAPRLRAGLVLLGIFVLLGGILGSAPAVADGEDLTAALEDYAAGRYEVALEKLRTYVANNPGDDEVYAILRDVDEKVLLRVLAKQGEHERLMKYLLDKARPGARQTRMDPDEIQELVESAVNDESLDVRRKAGVRLAVAGPLAVPYLQPYLARSDAAVVVNTMFALHRLGSSAVPPLVAVLDSDNVRVRGNAAAVLGDLRAPLAVPALLRMQAGDEDEGVRGKAAAALAKISGGLTLPSTAANAYWSLGERFYSLDPTVVMDFGALRAMWKWEDGQLVRYTLPAYLFGYQMAEQMAYDALALEPGLMPARSLLVRALLAQKLEAEVVARNGGEAPEVLAGAFDLAAVQGFDAATAALRHALKNRDWDVAIEAMHLCVATHGEEPLAGHPLGAALLAPERRVRYEAAISALYMSPQRGLPNADKVAHLAAQAASEHAVRQGLVIDDRPETRNRLLMDLAHAGYVAASSDNGAKGVSTAKNAPTLDFVIIRADLGSPSVTIPNDRHVSSITAIDELKHDARTRDMRIIVLIAETMEGKVEAIREFYETKYNDQIAGYITVPIDTASSMELVKEAAEAGELNPGRERANELAARAAMAFASTDFSCATYNLQIAVEPLATAATDGPTDEVKLAATMALGNLRKGGADALMQVLTGDGGDELKAAAATSLGQVLGVMDGTADQINALMEASQGDGPVALAALKALGVAKGLTPEQRRAAFEAHRLAVAEAAGS
jgi:HEAT repeat protein